MSELPSIHDKLNQPPIMEFEGFILRPYERLREFFVKDFRVVETAVSPDGGTSYLVEYEPREVGE